jgi:hypothetical protein
MLVHAETVSAAAPVAAAPRNRLRVNWGEETEVMLMMPLLIPEAGMDRFRPRNNA